MDCFTQDFWRVSNLVFPIYFRGFLHLFKSKYFQIKRRDFQECFAKEFSLSFSPPIQSKFFSHTLELSIAISSYKDLCCERILGDLSV